MSKDVKMDRSWSPWKNGCILAMVSVNRCSGWSLRSSCAFSLIIHSVVIIEALLVPHNPIDGIIPKYLWCLLCVRLFAGSVHWDRPGRVWDLLPQSSEEPPRVVPHPPEPAKEAVYSIFLPGIRLDCHPV